MKTLDAGESLLARWLDECGYAYEFEPADWGVGTCPDFRVDVRGATVAIEVESIESWGGFTDLKAGSGFSRPMAKALKPLRRKIAEGARQLKPLADSGLPLVVAVANPAGRPVPYSAEMMIAAMYGDPVYEFPADGGPGRFVVGRNGKLTNDHPYLSAVMVLREGPGVREAASAWFDANRHRFATAQDMAAEARRLDERGFFGDSSAVAADVIETAGSGVRLPAQFASGPDDTRFIPRADGSGLQRVR